MPEEKSIKRGSLSLKLDQVEDKILEMASLVPGLLKISGWNGKNILEVEIIIRSEFYKNEEKIPVETKHRLAEVRNHELQFGSYEGQRLDDIPLSYLEYLYESQRSLQEILKFYLKHPTIKRERENE